MPDELERLSKAATVYIWVRAGREVVEVVAPLGLMGVAGWMLLELYETTKPLIGG